ncbi:mycofactocin-coupled SDR family oxidoreductase [Nocardia macrotermitis]|uniref:Putative short-chain type dehydrogenase/reductase n=1 Tax=Nocardia macrotermitis TaxID=2585198 RepID=A0A7K0D856_9NOCA|nr:mycofactocin-coupled SDR family oxidoreductase [Nocardia macrotermitis]MQY21492.1 putative short-chain type dehydrogenase/reductase [Nocardia macrotermitis]
MGRVQDKVVFITGAARGQGRAHAIRLAEEGADIIAVDICADIDTNPYPLARREDLDETVRLVEKAGRRAVARVADVRDAAALKSAVDDGVAAFGRLDAVVAQASIAPLGIDRGTQAFIDVVAVGCNGVVHAVQAALPYLTAGGSIIATGSIAALATATTDNPALGPGGLGYSFAKRTVASFIHDLGTVLMPHQIRVNAIHPANVNTAMLHNEAMYRAFRPDLEHPVREDAMPSFPATTGMGNPYVEPEDIADMVLFLVSDESKWVTGMQMRVDSGGYLKKRPQQPVF